MPGHGVETVCACMLGGAASSWETRGGTPQCVTALCQAVSSCVSHIRSLAPGPNVSATERMKMSPVRVYGGVVVGKVGLA